MEIAGVAGPVTVKMNVIPGRHSVMVGRHELLGTWWGRYSLPGVAGSPEPIDIAGVAGPLIVKLNSLTGRHRVIVGRQEFSGTRKGHYILPTVGGGSVDARVRSSLIDLFPTIEVAGVKHHTGPALPVWMKLLVLFPLVLVFVGGILGGVIAGIAIVGNLAIARTKQSTAVKAALMVGVLAAAFLLWVMLVAIVLA